MKQCYFVDLKFCKITLKTKTIFNTIDDQWSSN